MLRISGAFRYFHRVLKTSESQTGLLMKTCGEKVFIFRIKFPPNYGLGLCHKKQGKQAVYEGASKSPRVSPQDSTSRLLCRVQVAHFS